MATAKGNLNRDLFGRCVYIGSKRILDDKLNIKNVKNTSTKSLNVSNHSTLGTMRTTGNARFRKNVTIDGDLTIKGLLNIPSDCANEQVAVNANAAYDAKKNTFVSLEAIHKANGTVDWATFKGDQELHKNKVVTLTNADFANGTLRVQQPCTLKLAENIKFNPNRPATWLDSGDSVTADFAQAAKLDPNRTLDWMPDPGATDNSQYFQQEVAFAYGLGFFAAIAIEAENVILDLAKYTLEQHPEHALMQRFFAVIELADQPFMPLQGPSNFGAILQSATNCLIKNGTIGLSSHHGIHGNDCDGVMIENVTFKDFEVAAISLNGSNDLFLKNITVTTNRRDIPVLGTFSAARFIQSFVKQVQDNGDDTTALNNDAQTLRALVDDTFNDIIFGSGNTIPQVFENATQLIDGTCYGLLINPKGVAVNAFLPDRTTEKANETTNIQMINCYVSNIKGEIKEIVGLANPDSGMQVDTAGALFQFFDGVANLVGDKYYYQGTDLANVQIELTRVKKTIDDASGDSSYLGTLNIHPGMVEWRDDPTAYFKVSSGQLQLFDGLDDPFLLGGNTVVYDIKCNGDSMFHVNKGCMGMRVDGASTMNIVNTTFKNIENVGNLGSELAGNYAQSHTNQNSSMVGYTGAQTFGIVLSAVNDVKTENLTITNVYSENSRAIGLCVQNASTNNCFENTIIGNVTSAKSFTGQQTLLPNGPGCASAIAVHNDCVNTSFHSTSISTIDDQTPFQKDVDIQCNGTIFT